MALLIRLQVTLGEFLFDWPLLTLVLVLLKTLMQLKTAVMLYENFKLQKVRKGQRTNQKYRNLVGSDQQKHL